MKLWAVAMVKDEVDVIEATLRHVAAQGVDGIIVADNGSTDGTREVLDIAAERLPCNVVIVGDSQVGYWQSLKMTALAQEAHDCGADWVWPFDADELFYWGATKKLADVVEHADGDWIEARLWHHFVTGLDANAGKGNPFTRMRYRSQEQAPIGKVIVKWQNGCTLLAGNHGCTFPAGHIVSSERDVQVRHFPYRSEDQFVSKAINGSRAYAATDLPWSTGQHWREYGMIYERGGEEALREVFRAHFVHDLPSASGLVYDPARLDS